jgi:hypothetical protein
MSGHKHAELMLQYANDALTNKTPWELWEVKMYDKWESVTGNFNWYEGYEYRRKPVKWSPIGGHYYISGEGHVVFHIVSDIHYKNFGHERPTKEQAERASIEMRKFNRLLALRDELCGDDFPISCTDKYFICYNDLDQCYIFCSNQYITQIFGLAYFPTIKLAQKACDMLNSGEVEL